MRVYRITIDLKVEDRISDVDLDDECELLSNEFMESCKYDNIKIDVDWKQGFYVVTDKGDYFMEGKNMEEVKKKWEMLHPEIKIKYITGIMEK